MKEVRGTKRMRDGRRRKEDERGRLKEEAFK